MVEAQDPRDKHPEEDPLIEVATVVAVVIAVVVVVVVMGMIPG